MSERISSLDSGYQQGDLSIYPLALDSIDETLYSVTNNAQAVLTQSLTYTAKYVVVDDASKFPDKGLLRIEEEIIYYDLKANNVFKNLKRGFANSYRGTWTTGSKVYGSVMAEHHNSVMDALVNIESNLGVKENPTAESLNGILKLQEQRFLSPKPLFRAVPRKGKPPLEVRFQNFSGPPPVRYVWDFGDGGTSIEKNPIHTYLSEGVYTVKLNMITELNGTGITTKKDYIVVSNEESLPFFYAYPLIGMVGDTFNFIDQTEGNITNRYWVWGDGENTVIDDPDVHTATHTYATAGEYIPELLLVFDSGKIKRISLSDTIIVSEP